MDARTLATLVADTLQSQGIFYTDEPTTDGQLEVVAHPIDAVWPNGNNVMLCVGGAWYTLAVTDPATIGMLTHRIDESLTAYIDADDDDLPIDIYEHTQAIRDTLAGRRK